MATSNSFVIVGMVGVVALVVLFSPNIDLEGNIAGQAINFYETQEDPNMYLDGTIDNTADPEKSTKETEEEPKDEILTGDTIDTIYYPGEGVSDDPDETSGTAQTGPDVLATVSTEPVGYECRDSDGGSAPNTRGVTEIVASDGAALMSHTDYCDDSRHVVEGTCDGTRISTGTIRCSRGARCSAGACSR